jgi:hypothetical protein
MRQKTYLTPAEQWDRTSALAGAEFGPPGYYGLVRQKAGYPTHEDGRLRDGPSGDVPIPGPLYLVRARVNHRLFLAGDVFVASSHANDERNPIYGVSSRGYTLRWYWVALFRSSDPRYRKAGPLRFYNNRVAVEWVELPGRLVGRFPTDPDVRSFVTGTLRAGASDCG